MKTFIYHDGALGDVLLSLPVIRHLGRQDGSVHFAGRGDVGTLLRELCIAADVSVAGDGRYSSLHAGKAGDEILAFLRQFGRAAVFTVDPSSPLVHAVRQAIPDTMVISTAPPAGSGIPVSRHRQEQAGLSGSPETAPPLRVPPLYRELAAGLLSRAGYDGFGPVLAVHPGSGGARKRWPLERFLELLGEVHDRGLAFIVVLSGPAEDDAFKDRLDAFSRGRFGVVHYADADLVGVAALLQASALYLGNDSGVSHLAAAVGCRTIVLFGPTDPAVWAPQGAGVETIHWPDLAGLPLGVVRDRVQAALGEAARGEGNTAGPAKGGG